MLGRFNTSLADSPLVDKNFNSCKYPNRVEIIFFNNHGRKFLISSNVENLLGEDFGIFSSGDDYVNSYDEEFKKIDDYEGMLDNICVRVLMYEKL